MAKKIKVPAGFIVMRHPDPNASASWDGVAYAPTDGYLVVPAQAVADLSSFGFFADGTDVEQAQAAPEPAPEAAPEPEPAPAPEPAPEA